MDKLNAPFALVLSRFSKVFRSPGDAPQDCYIWQNGELPDGQV
jgi:hypothetical protein